jgi:glucose dehydrogenase
MPVLPNFRAPCNPTPRGILAPDGLFFIGATTAEFFPAFDVSAGEELWRVRIPSRQTRLLQPTAGVRYRTDSDGSVHALTTRGPGVDVDSLEPAAAY